MSDPNVTDHDTTDDDWRDFGAEPPAYDIEALTGHIGPICGEWLKDDYYGWICCVRGVGACDTPDGRYHSSDYGLGWPDGVEDESGQKMETRPGPVGGVALPEVVVPPEPEPTPEDRALMAAMLKMYEAFGPFMVETRVVVGKPEK